MKKLIIVLLSLVMVVSLSACSGGSEAEPEEGSEQTVAESVFTGNYVVSADYVKENLDNILLYDARGEEAAAEGTIAQAVPVAWQYFATCEDGATGDANWGCILDPERLSARLGEKGFDKDKEIVIFAAADQGWGDDGRIAWELIAAGYTNVKIVDGGYNALVAAGLETSNGGAEPVPVEVTIESIDQTHVINTDELVSDYDQYKIVDARADEEYNGEVLYGESKGGHLPGAIHIPFGSLFDENGMLKSNEELTAIFEEAGLEKDDKIVTYCTAGIRSAFMQLIMEDCGYGNVKNYDESFYRWSAVQDVE
jgi:thiosulfate/3-mercaptopyruvate sulfurtransferase